MLHKGLILAISISVLVLASCATTQDSAMQVSADNMTACEKLQALVKGHGNTFDAIKGQLISSRYMSIWNSKVDVVGDSCQVWLTGDNRTTYVCTQVAPNEAVAQEWFKRSTETIGQCLGDWRREDRERKDGPGQLARWSRPVASTTVSAHVFPNRGAFKEHWTLYYFVGDRDDRF